DDDADRPVVLRGGTHHGRSADVDVLDAVLGARTGGHRLREGVQVHHEQVERRDVQRRELFLVVRPVAVREQARVHARVQRLDAAVERLGESGDLLDLRHRHTRVREDLRGAAGGDDLHPGGVQARAEFEQARLVRHPDQRTPNRALPGPRSLLAHDNLTFLPSTVHPARASFAITSTSRRRSVTLIRSCRLDSSSSGSTTTGSCAMIGPVSTPVSTKCTVDPVTLPPIASASATACMPGNAGSNAGCVLITRFGKVSRNAGPSSFMNPAETTRSGSYAATASLRALSQAARSGWSAVRTVKCGMPARSARSSASAPARSVPTATTVAGKDGSATASRTACNRVPDPEARTTSFACAGNSNLVTRTLLLAGRLFKPLVLRPRTSP